MAAHGLAQALDSRIEAGREWGQAPVIWAVEHITCGTYAPQAAGIEVAVGPLQAQAVLPALASMHDGYAGALFSALPVPALVQGHRYARGNAGRGAFYCESGVGAMLEGLGQAGAETTVRQVVTPDFLPRERRPRHS